MPDKLRCGALGTANIGLVKFCQPMQHGRRTTVHAIASRKLAIAKSSTALVIAKASTTTRYFPIGHEE